LLILKLRRSSFERMMMMAYNNCKVFFVLCLVLTASVDARCDKEEKSGWSWWHVGGALAGGALTVIAAPIVLPVAGFTAAGVAAGSAAAVTQGYIGSIAAGSAFAALQSAGAAGIGIAGNAALAAAGAGIGAVVADKAVDD
jgi:hypothetical protein